MVLSVLNVVTKNHSCGKISLTFNIFSYKESATANTIFHKVKFGVRKYFSITFDVGTVAKSLFVSYMSVRYGVTQETA